MSQDPPQERLEPGAETSGIPRRLDLLLAVALAVLVGLELALGLELRPAPPAPGTTGLVGIAATVAVLVVRWAVLRLLGARRA